jgi:PEP-CTERM motif
LLLVFAPGHAAAGFCSSTSCSLTLTNSNFIGTGTFGTVNLALSSNVVTVDVNLASTYRIVRTGFPGVAGFADNLGGRLTIGNFKTGGVSTALYSGSRSLPLHACSNKDCKWSGFGNANNAAALDGPQRSFSLQQLSFTVSKGTSITDIRQLLQRFGDEHKGPAYFAVDGCVWNPTMRDCKSTGLFAATQVPEPASLVILASGLLTLGLLRWRRMI